MRFIGTIEARIDNKGRVFFPAAFRRVLEAAGEQRIAMRRDVFENCLVLYPESVWNKQVDALASRLNRWNAEHRQVMRRFVSDVELLSLDANGRLLLPRRYQEMASLQGDVVFVGVDDNVELWAAERFAAERLDDDRFASLLQGIMKNPEP